MITDSRARRSPARRTRRGTYRRFKLALVQIFTGSPVSRGQEVVLKHGNPAAIRTQLKALVIEIVEIDLLIAIIQRCERGAHMGRGPIPGAPIRRIACAALDLRIVYGDRFRAVPSIV